MMTQQFWPHNQQSQSRALFASPPSTGLPYPSYTPHPSRTNTPAYSTSRSSSSSSNSFGHQSVGHGSIGHHSVGHSSVGKTPKHSWKRLLNSNNGSTRSQTAPWKHTSSIGSPTPPQPMSYYNYYQQAPGWATAQYEPGPPPMPSYHPAANWGGYDYYAAHSGENDRSLFDSIWGRFKSAIGVATQGFSRQHAKQIYRRVYGGVADLIEVSPDELGAAAGYEAIRIWEYHHNLYQTPLNHDLEREREALGGLAIGEANKLWVRANPYRNRHGRRTCAEIAMATAERIFTFQYDQQGGVAPYLSPEQQLANSNLMNPALIQSPYEQGYERGGPGYERGGPGYERGYEGRPRTVSFSNYGGGRRSRRGSWSNYDQPAIVPVGGGLPPVSGIPIGGLGTYQNAQGYTIAPGPPMGGVPFPGEYPPSPRFAGQPLGPEPYDDYVIPTGAPGSYGGGGYGPPLGAPGSYGGGGYAQPLGAPGSYGGGGYAGPTSYGSGGGYEGAYIAPPTYRRQRSRSQNYGRY